MDIIIDIHSWVRWLVILALVGGAGIGFFRNSRGEPWQEGFFSLAVIVVDVQVLLGIIIWVFNSGWEAGFFFAVLHPLMMLAPWRSPTLVWSGHESSMRHDRI